MVSTGEFREDLFYRINSFPVYLPALRERQQDIPLLAKSMLLNLSDNLLLHFSEEALRFLSNYAFPGNIRELRNLVERAIILCNGNCIELADIQPQQSLAQRTIQENATTPTVVPLREHEQRYLETLDRSFKGSKAELAAALGISERTLYRKLDQKPHRKLNE